MIDATILPFFTGLFPIICAITLLVLRAGASRVFFDIVGTFQAGRLIQDAQAAQTVFESLYLDTFMGIQEAGQEIGEMFTNVVEEIMPLTEEIEEARIQLEKFLDVPTDEMDEVAQSITDIGLALGFASDEAMLAGAKMAQLSGVLGASTMDVGTEIGMMFGLISGMETDAAMQRLINLQQQTKFMTKNIEEGMNAEEQANIIRRDSIRILNQLNTVENRSVATMEQITFVMNQFASQADLTNESIASMAALSATLIEAGEEQGKGGRALRMMYARLGADINGSRKAVEDLGIAVADSEGNMRPLSRVLSDLSVEYQKMNGEQQTALAQQVAGNRHYTRLIKLLENVDRVKELEFEATIAMFPAMDEIDRRRDTELFKLQKAEAAYKNVAGSIGDNLLPALTKATEAQTVFLKQIEQLSQNKFFGFAINSIVTFTKLSQSFVGPALGIIMALQNMNIALKTQAAITRALNGEKIAGMEHTKEGLVLMTNEIALQKELNRRNQEEALITERKRRQESTKGKGLGTRNVNYARTRSKNLEKLRKTELAGLKEISREQAKLIYLEERHRDAKLSLGTSRKKIDVEARAFHAKRQEEIQKEIDNTYLKKDIILANAAEISARKQVYDDVVAEAKDRELRKEVMLQEAVEMGTKQQAKRMQTITMGIAALGSSFMMFNVPFMKQQTEMRIGMTLTSGAMAYQTGKMMYNSIISVKQMFVKRALTKAFIQEAAAIGLTNTQIIAHLEANNVKNASQLVGIATTEVYSAAHIKLAKAIGISNAALKKSIIGIAAVVAIMAGWWVFDKWTEKAKKAADEQERFNSISLDTGRVLEIMKDGTMDVESEIQKLTKELNGLDDTQDKMSQARITAIESEIAALMQVRRITNFQNTDMKENMEASKKYFDDLKMYESINKGITSDGHNFFSMGTVDTINNSNTRFLNQLGNIFRINDKEFKGYGAFATATDDVREFREEYSDLVAFIELHKITTYEELETTAESYKTSINELMGVEAEGVSNLAQEYSVLNDELQGFANTREEMFYGFDRNNLTGDLVRQVTQQGVETLVTTTEVIMTNNFNGMTVPQVADMIIEEIEGRGNLRGYNLSTT